MSTVIPIIPMPTAPISTALEGDGMGCHSGGDAMLAAAKSAGKSEILDQYAKDYPKDPKAGPHDQTQGTCFAVGRAGLPWGLLGSPWRTDREFQICQPI